ncbi:carboxypeptidase regulatory-like domain-containing protein [Acidipila sp. 4G-K13]|nr:carboxypeptidase regulatory-like domain-containing protein [Paracidobacterium acidisoli]
MMLLLSAATLHAQEFRAAMIGTVTDNQGRIVVHASVEVRDVATGTVTNTITDKDGDFEVRSLIPDTYDLTVESPGFERFLQRGLTLEVGSHPSVKVVLHPGTVSQQVVVNSDAPLLETTTTVIGSTITAKDVEDLPLNGRTPIMLAQLGVGVASTDGPGQYRPFDNAGAVSISIAGTPDESTEVLLDGSPDTDNLLKLAYSPPQDIVKSVTSHVFQTDAGYGHSGGGIMNQITKGGSNQFHGSLYEYNQSAVLASNDYFSDRTGTPKENDHYNQYGLSISGPVILPKIFNGHNKLFFLFGWEGIRDQQPASGYLTVPTDAERKGDFSALLGLNPATVIYDPTTAVQNANGSITRTAFSGNVIPTTSINPIASKLMTFYPEPNTAGAADGSLNYFTKFPSKDLYDNEFGRLDVNLGSRDSLFVDMRHSLRNQVTSNFLHNDATGFSLARENYGGTVDNVYTINPTTVADVRANWTRYENSDDTPTDGDDPTQLGFPGYLSSTSTLKQYPSIQFTGCNSTSATFACLFSPAHESQAQWTESYQLFGDVSTLWHGHSLTIGVDTRQYRYSAINYNYPDGEFAFSSNFTKQSSSATPATLGPDLAALLLGLPSSGDYDKNIFTATHNNYLGLFVQDDWRVARNLVVNLGLRFDHDFPLYERHDRAINGFDPSIVTPLAAKAETAYNKNPIAQIPAGQFAVPGGVTFADSARPQIYNTPSKIFSPRVGFAWTPDYLRGKTVVSGAYSIFVAPIMVQADLNTDGYSASTTYVATNNNYLTSAANLSDPFPSGFTQPTGNTLGASTYQGKAMTFLNENIHNPYSSRYALTIQQQLAKNLSLQLSYMGAQYVKLLVSDTQINAIPRQYLATGQTRNNTVISLLSSSVANPFAGLLTGTTLNGTTVSRSQLLAPYPQYPVSSGLDMQQKSNGTSNYNSLNAALTYRSSRGLSGFVHYTWSRTIDQNSLLNATDLHYEKRISPFDYPHHFVIAGTYTLPYATLGGQGATSHLMHSTLGGWAVSAIYTAQSGSPLQWGNLIYYGGSLKLNPRDTTTPAFDTTQFNTISSQQLGNNIRTFHSTFSKWRQDGINNLDMALAKQFRFTERYLLEFRAEAFNLPNHPTFGTPNLTPTSSSFGLITSQYNTQRIVQVSGHIRF